MVFLPLTEDVNGDDLRGGGEGGVEGGVIVKAKVATEPMNDTLHGGWATPAGGRWIRALTAGQRWAKRVETGRRSGRAAT